MTETKDRVIILRIDRKLADEFKAKCKGNMSETIRKLIEGYCHGK